MFWIFLVLVAQLANAVVFLADKYFVASPAVNKPAVYASYAGLLSGAVVVLLPFGLVHLPSQAVVLLSVIAGVSFIFSILFSYKALKIADASDVAPVIGALGAIATLGFSLIFLQEKLAGNFLIAFIFLVAGTFAVSYFRFPKKVFVFLLASGVLFGLSSAAVKAVFNITSFWDGLFWTRIGNVLGILILASWPANLKSMLKHARSSSAGIKSAVVLNKILSGAAFLAIFYAIKLGDVSLVNALGGVQFIFLLALAVIFTKKLPGFLYETVHDKRAIIQKIVATVLIVSGLALLFV